MHYINELLIKLKDEYLLSLKEIEKTLPSELPKPQDYLHADNNLTVGELKKQWDNYRESIEQKRVLKDLQNKGFSPLLEKNGFINLYDAVKDSDFIVDWGHNHGENLKYGSNKEHDDDY